MVTTNRTIDDTDNLLDEAMKAEMPNRVYFGQLLIDKYACVLEKGVGKVLFDPAVHAMDRRLICLHLSLLPMSSQPMNPIERDVLAPSAEWARFVLPSIKALNSDLRLMNEKWVKAEMVPTRTYTKTNPDTGEEQTKQATTFKFLAIYQTEQECRTASDAFWSTASWRNPNAPASIPEVAQPEPISADRAVAAGFLPALWKVAGFDRAKMAGLVSQTALVKDHFTINSPEVEAVMKAQAA